MVMTHLALLLTKLSAKETYLSSRFRMSWLSLDFGTFSRGFDLTLAPWLWLDPNEKLCPENFKCCRVFLHN